jgi:uncharacterized lipoprotein YehR (DUF1307 family)
MRSRRAALLVVVILCAAMWLTGCDNKGAEKVYAENAALEYVHLSLFANGSLGDYTGIPAGALA